jgi:hypothetical protein
VVAVLVAVTLAVAGIVAYESIGQPANHPQLDLAGAAVARLNSGADPAAVVPARQVQIGTPETYLMVLDSNGAVLATSAHLNGATPVPPSGVLDYARAHGDDRVTWQPAPGVRSAIVVEAFHGGFVVAGRTLSDAENLQGSLVRFAIGAWLLVVVGSVLLLVLSRKPSGKLGQSGSSGDS